MMLDLEEALKLPNILDDFLDYYHNNQDKKVYLYGAGAGLIWNVKLMEKYGIPVAAIVDQQYTELSNAALDGKSYRRMPLNLCKEPDPIFIISAPAHELEIRAFLSDRFKASRIYCLDATLDILQNRKSTGQYRDYVKAHIPELNEIYDCLADAASKKVLKNVLCGGITYNLDYYREVASRNVYFPDVVRARMGAEEVFVDAGAFTGDTIEEFVEAAGEEGYRAVYAFEPDQNNYQELVKMAGRTENLKIMNKGCFDRTDTLFFKGASDQTDAGACIVDEENATQKIEVVKLDDVIQDPVTFIKMDIEGSELAALRGAEKIIKNNKPKLAISIYHKMEDIVEIISFIRTLGLDYDLYLYHFWECAGSDTVVVAV